jgi:hypothetical protein
MNAVCSSETKYLPTSQHGVTTQKTTIDSFTSERIMFIFTFKISGNYVSPLA